MHILYAHHWALDETGVVVYDKVSCKSTLYQEENVFFEYG